MSGPYGPFTGIAILFDKVNQVGKLLGLNDGTVQAYLDSDGKLKWAAGKGVADATGIAFAVTAGTASQQILWSEGSDVLNTIEHEYLFDTPMLLLTARPKAGTALDSSGISLAAYNHALTDYGSILISPTDTLGVGLRWKDATHDVQLTVTLDGIAFAGGPVNGGSQRYTNLANAAADTDALNRQTGDARYLAVGTTAYLKADGTVAGAPIS